MFPSEDSCCSGKSNVSHSEYLSVQYEEKGSVHLQLLKSV